MERWRKGGGLGTGKKEMGGRETGKGGKRRKQRQKEKNKKDRRTVCGPPYRSSTPTTICRIRP